MKVIRFTATVFDSGLPVFVAGAYYPDDDAARVWVARGAAELVDAPENAEKAAADAEKAETRAAAAREAADAAAAAAAAAEAAQSQTEESTK